MVNSGIRNSSAVRVGDDLSGSAECKVLEVQEDAIKFDSRLLRREASGLEKVEVSLDPNIWAGAFFQGWGAFWCREGGVEQGNPWRPLLHSLPSVPEQALGLITFEDWKAALGRAKAASMRGTCGWSVSELRRLPEEADIQYCGERKRLAQATAAMAGGAAA